MPAVASGSNTPYNLSSPASSRTVIETRARSPLDDELERDEAHFEKYGGDDPEDPPLRTSQSSNSATHEAPSSPAFGKGKDVDPNLVDWDGPNDPKNPQNWSRKYKWFVTVFCSILTLNVTFASSMPSTATALIQAEFDIPTEVSYLVTSIFVLGYVFGPLLWGPGSELFGRRPIMTITLCLYTIFHLGQALAPNMETLLVTRFISGFFACAPLTNGGGLIADIWDPVGRGPSTSMFSTMVFLGPCFGPLVGGFIVQSGVGWRWVFWVEMMFAGACALSSIVLMPETYAPVILLQKAKRLRKADPVGNKDLFAEAEREKWTAAELCHRTVLRPFSMLLQEPILVLVTIYLSVVYGVIYALFEALPIVFVERHGLTTSQGGLIFIGVGLGSCVGGAVNQYFLRDYPELLHKWRGFTPPEKRLQGAMVGAPSLVIGAFWLGWTGQYASVPWYVPALATIPLGTGISLVFISFLSYLIDTYLMYSASAFAANTVCRSVVGAAFPLFTVQLYTNLGINWASTLIGFIALVMAPMPFLFYKYGPRIRGASKFAPCLDLKIAKEMAAERQADAEKANQHEIV